MAPRKRKPENAWLDAYPGLDMKISIELESINELYELKNVLSHLQQRAAIASDSSKISELQLTNRAKNCLSAEKIETIYELCQLSEMDLRRGENMGVKTIAERQLGVVARQ